MSSSGGMCATSTRCCSRGGFVGWSSTRSIRKHGSSWPGWSSLRRNEVGQEASRLRVHRVDNCPAHVLGEQDLVRDCDAGLSDAIAAMLPGAYSNSRVPLPHLNERQRRSMLAAEARFLGTAVCELLPGRLGSARGAAQAATQPGTAVAAQRRSGPGRRPQLLLHRPRRPARDLLRRLGPDRRPGLGQCRSGPRHLGIRGGLDPPLMAAPRPSRLPGGVPITDHRGLWGLQQLPLPGLESRTGRLRRRNGSDRHGLPLPAGHLQVEQD